MSELTGIAWTHHTFNPWWGCQRVSPGCEHCYAETFANRLRLGIWGPEAPRRFFGDAHWNEPLAWNRKAAAAGVRRRVFCASMADIFERRPELDAWRLRVWELIAATPALDWQLLTKRPENVWEMVPRSWVIAGAWPRNAWLGVTAEDQRWAELRVPLLVELPAPVRFVSYEPALGPLGLRRWLGQLQWVIVGGESGSARPFELDWARMILHEAGDFGVPVFVKQLGARVLDGKDAGRPRVLRFEGKADDPEAWPEELQVREFPASVSA